MLVAFSSVDTSVCIIIIIIITITNLHFDNVGITIAIFTLDNITFLLFCFLSLNKYHTQTHYDILYRSEFTLVNLTVCAITITEIFLVLLLL